MISVVVEEVEEDAGALLLCRINGRAHWLPKADIAPIPSGECGKPDYAGCVLGECGVTIQIPESLAREKGLMPEPMPDLPPIGYCNRCDAAIRWFETSTGKRMPIDAAPVEYGGNIVIRGGHAVVLSKKVPGEAGEKRWMPHFATCGRRKGRKT